MSTHCPRCSTITGSQFHCGQCHQTFGGLRAFDRHRNGPIDDRHCTDGADLGLVDRGGIWREPIDPKSLTRITGGHHGAAPAA
jgi:hypothetical protein